MSRKRVTVGLIGLGAMGTGMLTRLRETSHEVLCFDADPGAMARAAGLGGTTVASTAELGGGACAVILLSLPRAEVVRSVMRDLMAQLAPGTVVVDTSTSEPETTRALAAEAQARGAQFLDAPVSGGPRGARDGTMSMIVGGDVGAFEQVRPVLERMTGKLLHIGPSGAGHTAKIANNLLCAANLVLVSEMAHLARRGGVALEDLLAGVNAGSGRSGVSEANYPRWIMTGAYDSGFTMGLMRKDVGLACALADRLGLDLPATRAIAGIWNDSRALLSDDADFNEIHRYGCPDD
ncbi:MAG: NAD(P)-dependent oxidoreductase [Alkalilacustris sp.]